MTPNDFWNLAGRAGRWGKEFSGNIVCIEPTKWRIQPNPNKSKQKIERAIDKIENDGSELLKYISDKTPRELANTRQDLEFAFGYFYTKYLEGELRESGDFSKALINQFEQLTKSIIIPDYIIKRNPGISPIAQQELFEYFKSKDSEIEKLIPVYPEDENAIADYTKLVGRIGKTLSSYFHATNNAKAILLINWMSGKPLSYLIVTSYNWYQSREKYKNKKTLPVVIREVMDDVENFVRFRFAKDSSCYVDILRYYLEITHNQKLIEQIPELNLWLEFGVSQKTHLSLLSLGLTRNTVVELANYIINTQMNKEECMAWLRTQNLDLFELSPIIKADVEKLFLGQHNNL